MRLHLCTYPRGRRPGLSPALPQTMILGSSFYSLDHQKHRAENIRLDHLESAMSWTMWQGLGNRREWNAYIQFYDCLYLYLPPLLSHTRCNGDLGQLLVCRKSFSSASRSSSSSHNPPRRRRAGNTSSLLQSWSGCSGVRFSIRKKNCCFDFHPVLHAVSSPVPLEISLVLLWHKVSQNGKWNMQKT